mmetsp:Transcript_23289/g.72875  ORF Transcript_23289/g.72875 Transcript_23289/m.72875 type:complete len:105 (-) Transcript_23289:358-672(-)
MVRERGPSLPFARCSPALPPHPPLRHPQPAALALSCRAMCGACPRAGRALKFGGPAQQGRFQQMSDSIIGRIDEMGGRIDELEKSIGELIQQAGVDDDTTKALE